MLGGTATRTFVVVFYRAQPRVAVLLKTAA